MPFPLAGAILGGIGGLFKAKARQRQAKAQSKLRAAQIRETPFQGQGVVTAEVPQGGSVFGDILGGATLGGNAQQGFSKFLGGGGGVGDLKAGLEKARTVDRDLNFGTSIMPEETFARQTKIGQKFL